MIYRHNRWDLPKGKIEPGETIEACAIREVEEECGVSNLRIIDQLIDTYHIYQLDSDNILKKTSWFKMQTNFKGVLSPQIEEGIEKAVWVDKYQIHEKLNDSFENIKEIVNNDLIGI